jgi:hypothetical protein
MRTTHTPGPWKIAMCDDGSGEVVPEVGFGICVMNLTVAERVEPNARLIAAAPEMLEALKLCAELMTEARKHFPKSIKHRDKFQLENTCATINKAITKAEGE